VHQYGQGAASKLHWLEAKSDADAARPNSSSATPATTGEKGPIWDNRQIGSLDAHTNLVPDQPTLHQRRDSDEEDLSRDQWPAPAIDESIDFTGSSQGSSQGEAWRAQSQSHSESLQRTCCCGAVLWKDDSRCGNCGTVDRGSRQGNFELPGDAVQMLANEIGLEAIHQADNTEGYNGSDKSLPRLSAGGGSSYALYLASEATIRRPNVNAPHELQGRGSQPVPGHHPEMTFHII
jgi:hypothetical protein